MCPCLIEIGSKTAEKNCTNKQTNRHYENNGHLANQKRKAQTSLITDVAFRDIITSTRPMWRPIWSRQYIRRLLYIPAECRRAARNADADPYVTSSMTSCEGWRHCKDDRPFASFRIRTASLQRRTATIRNVQRSVQSPLWMRVPVVR